MPHRANSMPGNLRANRIRNPRAKQQFRGRRNLRKRHHLIPNFLRRSIHFNRGAHLKRLRLRLRPTLYPLERRRKQQHDHQRCRSAFVQPISRLNRVPQHAPKGPERQRKRRRHQNTNHSLDHHQEQDRPKQRNGHQRNSDAAGIRSRLVVAVHQHRKQPQAKRQRHKQSPPVRLKHLRPQYGKHGANHNRHPDGSRRRPQRASRNPSVQPARLRPRRRFALCLDRMGTHRAKQKEKQKIDHRNKKQHHQPQRLPGIAQSLDRQRHAQPNKGQRQNQQRSRKCARIRWNGIHTGIRPQRLPVAPQKPWPLKHHGRYNFIEEIFQDKSAATRDGIRLSIDFPLPSPHLHKTVRHGTSSPLHGARNRHATPLPRNPPVSFAQNFRHPRNFRHPQQRPCPPNLTRQRHGRIRPSESASVAQKKLHFSHQVLARQSQQRPHSRILQWGQRHSTPLQNRRKPPCDSRAEPALRVKEHPSPRVPPLPVCVLTHQRNHRFFSFLLLRVSLRSRCNWVIFFSSLLFSSLLFSSLLFSVLSASSVISVSNLFHFFRNFQL